MGYSGNQTPKVPIPSKAQPHHGLRKLTMANQSLNSSNTTLDLAEDTSLKQTEPSTEAGDYWLAYVKDD